MLDFIKIWIAIMMVLITARWMWRRYICPQIGWRLLNSDRFMNIVKENNPEKYEKYMELKRLIEEAQE